MQNQLSEMLKLFSEEDKAIFNSLAEKLREAEGDISRLSEDERVLIGRMEAKYGEKINQTHQRQNESQALNDILDMPFALHVRQILARDLGEQIPEEEAAIQYAFENKWLPVDCQDEELIEDLYSRFEQDICEVNQWREDLVGVESDKKLALGLAWFMVIYQLQQRFNG